MWSLTKFLRGEKQNAEVSVVVDEAPQVTEQQLYEDVFFAQERLLNEAKDILSKPPIYDQERYKLLGDLYAKGFRNAEEMEEYKAIEKSIADYDRQKAKQDKMLYYKHTYPLHRFIDSETVIAICEKYNLYLTSPDRYTAEIPDKNKKEIANFLVKRCDSNHTSLVKPRDKYGNGGALKQYAAPIIPSSGFRLEDVPNWIAHVNPYSITPIEVRVQMAIANQRLRTFPTDYFQYDATKTEDENNKFFEDFKNEKICGHNLLIVAPEHKLNTTGMKKFGRILIQDDPIVLQPVHEGYLINSAWGIEAGDEDVVNSINN